MQLTNEHRQIIAAAGLELPTGGYTVDGFVPSRQLDDDYDPAILRAHFTSQFGDRGYVTIKAWESQEARGGWRAVASVSRFPMFLTDVLDETDLERLKAGSLEYNSVDGPARLDAKTVATIGKTPDGRTVVADNGPVQTIPYAPPLPALDSEPEAEVVEGEVVSLEEVPPDLLEAENEGWGSVEPPGGWGSV